MDSIFRSSVHTHTSFCDGKDTAEVMVKKAIELGFVSLGFSEHGPTSWEPVALKPEAEPIYREEIHRMQQLYGDQLEIILGLEHEYLGDPIHYEYDYVIESVHAIDVDGQLCYVDYDAEKMQTGIRQFFGGDPYAYAKAYFHTCCQAYEHATGQIAGHIDLLTKFNEQVPVFRTDDPRFLKPALEAVDCALNCNLIPELNTGAISRGYRSTPYPCVPILQYLKDRNAPIVVTSDCHNANYLDCWFAEAAELLRSLGFRSTLRMRKSGWEEIGL